MRPPLPSVDPGPHEQWASLSLSLSLSLFLSLQVKVQPATTGHMVLRSQIARLSCLHLNFSNYLFLSFYLYMHTTLGDTFRALSRGNVNSVMLTLVVVVVVVVLSEGHVRPGTKATNTVFKL